MKRRMLVTSIEEVHFALCTELFGDEYEVASAASGPECLARLMAFRPEVVLLDATRSGLDGYDTCRQIKAASDSHLSQVILILSKGTTADRSRGHEAGADDCMIVPLDRDELRARVRIQFRLRGLLAELAEARAKIDCCTPQSDAMMREGMQKVVATRDLTVFALAKLAESREPETGEHLERIRAYSRILAQVLSDGGPYADEIDDRFLSNLCLSSTLHDIGKIGIPDAILLKPDRLSPNEFEIMKQHTVIGAEALARAAKHADAGGFLAMSARIARSHHERFDGTGYPDELRGIDIPLAARIVALADVYDALTSVRVYKAALDPELARCLIEQEADEHFDPHIVAAFQNCWMDFVEVRNHIHRQAPARDATAGIPFRDLSCSDERALAGNRA